MIKERMMFTGIVMIALAIVYMFSIVAYRQLTIVNSDYQESVIRDTFNG